MYTLSHTRQWLPKASKHPLSFSGPHGNTVIVYSRSADNAEPDPSANTDAVLSLMTAPGAPKNTLYKHAKHLRTLETV